MDVTQPQHGNNRTRAENGWKLGMLLVLVLFIADLLINKTALRVQSAAQDAKTTTDFLIVKVGDFRAEIQWSNGKQQ